jgi:hypothetical protein
MFTATKDGMKETAWVISEKIWNRLDKIVAQ